MTDRFRVVSVTGWPINPRSASSGVLPATLWYVLDSANCYRTERGFRRWSSKSRNHLDPEGDARRLAARLNAEYP